MECKIAEDGTKSPRTFEIRIECPAAVQPAVLAGLQRFGRNRIIDEGFLNAATVSGFLDTLYFVVTDSRGQREDNAYRTWKNEMKKVTCPDLRKLPEVAKVGSVRPFTRLSQRRFGWGDVQATKSEVVAAVHEENCAELLAILPEAKPLIQRNELEQLPALFDAMRSRLPAALGDCRHQLFTEHMGMAKVLGPCGSCHRAESEAYTMGFTRCSACGCVRCKPCAAAIVTDQDRQQSFLRAYHEIKDAHTWEASREVCDLCGKGPCGCGSKHCDDCRADVQTKRCACGTVRCSKCLHVHVWRDLLVQVEATPASPARSEMEGPLALPPASFQQRGVAPSSVPRAKMDGCSLCGKAPRKVCSCGEARCEQCFALTRSGLVETWSHAHPLHQPATCYITDQFKTKATDKLKWIVFELGHDADLISFALKYRELFGANAQKAKCLDLYRQYANVAKREERGPYRTVAEARKKLYSMECQVPPGELEEFQKLWDEDALRCCHECHCELPGGAPLGQHFCSAEHEHADKQIFCTNVAEHAAVNGDETARRCNGNVVYRNSCRVCTDCGQGSDVAKIVARSQKRTDETVNRQSDLAPSHLSLLGPGSMQTRCLEAGGLAKGIDGKCAGCSATLKPAAAQAGSCLRQWSQRFVVRTPTA